MRAAHRLKTPDAIQLATARRSGATAFLTNDNHFDGVAGLEVVTLDGLLLSA
jgi:predicted nucleic acid-binding protein